MLLLAVDDNVLIWYNLIRVLKHKSQHNKYILKSLAVL